MLKKANLGIEPADVLEDKSRIVHIVGRFRAAESIDTVAFYWVKMWLKTF